MSRTEHVPHLIGREQDADRLWEILSGRSTLLIGPRRIGKTELIRAICAAPKAGWHAVRVDLEKARTGEEAADLVAEAMSAIDLGPGLPTRAARAFKSVEVMGVGGELVPDRPLDAWSRLEESVASGASRLAGGARLLLALDEVPWLLDALRARGGAEAARTCLAVLRRIRQRDDLCDRVRLILTGSIGLSGLASDIGASAELNDITPAFHLPPLVPAAGATLFEMEVTQRGGSLSKEAASIAHAEAGGSPHWLKLLAERTGGAGGRVDAAALSRAVDELLSPRMRGLFADEGHEHLLRRYGPDTSRTLASILNACAGDDGAPFEALVTAALAVDPQLRRRGAEELIYRLADEYYLTPATPPDPWRFTLPLLRKWWLRYGGAR